MSPKTTPLKLAILQSGMNQFELADKTNINISVLNTIINGWRLPTSKQAKAIAKALKTDREDLFTEEKPNGV